MFSILTLKYKIFDHKEYNFSFYLNQDFSFDTLLYSGDYEVCNHIHASTFLQDTEENIFSSNISSQLDHQISLLKTYLITTMSKRIMLMIIKKIVVDAFIIWYSKESIMILFERNYRNVMWCNLNYKLISAIFSRISLGSQANLKAYII